MVTNPNRHPFWKWINANYLQDRKFRYVLLVKHHRNYKKNNEHSRWWIDWYKYFTCNHTNQIFFGDRVLIRPNFIPLSAKYIQWALHIDISPTGNHYLLETFNFIPITNQNRTKHLIPCSKWKLSETICLNNNLFTPTIGSISSHQIKSTQPNKTRTRKLA